MLIERQPSGFLQNLRDSQRRVSKEDECNDSFTYLDEIFAVCSLKFIKW